MWPPLVTFAQQRHLPIISGLFSVVVRPAIALASQPLVLEETQRQRAHAQRMDALGQLTGGVAHDFNNLLMIVSGHIPALKNAVADDPKLSRAANAIAHAAKRGETLTRQLLTFSRRQTINPAVVQLADRIGAARPILESFVGSAVRVRIAIGAGIWAVKVDDSEFELALVNLAINARDAMPKGGVLAITAENVILSVADTLARIEGEFVAVRVTDDGAGIAPDVLSKVFDPFFTTKEVGKGSGLGLSQVHGFAHQSGGTVRIESEIGRGTTVTIYLPRSQETAEAVEGDRHVETATSGTVLIVEDDPQVLSVCVSMFDQLGYTTYAVSGASAALEVIEKQCFDLVVSDVVMPGDMDGAALANAIRARKPELPVLLVTGFSPSTSNSEFPILRKPYDLSALSSNSCAPHSRGEAAAGQQSRTA